LLRVDLLLLLVVCLGRSGGVWWWEVVRGRHLDGEVRYFYRVCSFLP
jgi:hypothetical protein